jgi:hypothetical protein
MKSHNLSKMLYAAMAAVVLSVIFPVAALGQRRWVVVRPHRSRIVIYNRQAPVIYQRGYRSNTYAYPQTYYGNQYSTYGNSQPYYSNQYYSYRYSQPYFANPNTYAYTNPSYSYYDGYRERPRHRRNGVRIRLRF